MNLRVFLLTKNTKVNGVDVFKGEDIIFGITNKNETITHSSGKFSGVTSSDTFKSKNNIYTLFKINIRVLKRDETTISDTIKSLKKDMIGSYFFINSNNDIQRIKYDEIKNLKPYNEPQIKKKRKKKLKLNYYELLRDEYNFNTNPYETLSSNITIINNYVDKDLIKETIDKELDKYNSFKKNN